MIHMSEITIRIRTGFALATILSADGVSSMVRMTGSRNMPETQSSHMHIFILASMRHRHLTDSSYAIALVVRLFRRSASEALDLLLVRCR